MMIAYATIFSKKRESDFDTSPDLIVGEAAGSVLLTLETSDFDIKHKKGVATVSLAKPLSSIDLRWLSKLLLEAADRIDNPPTWVPNDVANFPSGVTLTGKVKLDG